MTRRKSRPRVSTQPAPAPAKLLDDDAVDRKLTELLVSMWKLELKLVALQDKVSKLKRGARQP
jgi:hypothetical protein